MTTNTNAAQVANNLIAVAEDQAFEAWYKQDCLVGGVNARIAARAAWNARAALTTAAAVPATVVGEKFQRAWVQLDQLPGTMMVGTEGRFGPIPASTSAWITTSERERDRCLSAGKPMLEVWLAAAPKAEPVPAGEYPPLPTGSAWCGDDDVRDFGTGPGESALMFAPTQTQQVPLFTADQMHAYADTTHALRIRSRL